MREKRTERDVLLQRNCGALKSASPAEFETKGKDRKLQEFISKSHQVESRGNACQSHRNQRKNKKKFLSVQIFTFISLYRKLLMVKSNLLHGERIEQRKDPSKDKKNHAVGHDDDDGDDEDGWS